MDFFAREFRSELLTARNPKPRDLKSRRKICKPQQLATKKPSALLMPCETGAQDKREPFFANFPPRKTKETCLRVAPSHGWSSQIASRSFARSAAGLGNPPASVCRSGRGERQGCAAEKEEEGAREERRGRTSLFQENLREAIICEQMLSNVCYHSFSLKSFSSPFIGLIWTELSRLAWQMGLRLCLFSSFFANQ